VAIGSSSTAGEADVLPYPSRLDMLLRDRFRDRMIDVLNRGIGGQEAPSELLRFETDVAVEAPALVSSRPLSRGCLDWRPLPIDVLIMDWQYTPAERG
jgi:hypothetical protein